MGTAAMRMDNAVSRVPDKIAAVDSEWMRVPPPGTLVHIILIQMAVVASDPNEFFHEYGPRVSQVTALYGRKSPYKDAEAEQGGAQPSLLLPHHSMPTRHP